MSKAACDHTLSRRAVMAGLSAAAVGLAFPAAAAEDALAALEARAGGRLGVFALDTGSGRSFAHRADERFLMCSTTKLVFAGAILKRVDAGEEQLDRWVSYGAKDLDVGYTPDTKAHLTEGRMSVEALCRAAITHSDNGAANLILASLGGPAAVTRFARSLGDEVTRFDRAELALNRRDGERDTTTPRAYAATTRALLLGAALSPASRDLLNRWMVECTTGLARIRAGAPAGWTVGDKTGTAEPFANDVALLRPPGGSPIVVTAFYEVTDRKDAEREAVLRDVGAIAAGLAG